MTKSFTYLEDETGIYFVVDKINYLTKYIGERVDAVRLSNNKETPDDWKLMRSGKLTKVRGHGRSHLITFAWDADSRIGQVVTNNSGQPTDGTDDLNLHCSEVKLYEFRVYGHMLPQHEARMTLDEAFVALDHTSRDVYGEIDALGAMRARGGVPSEESWETVTSLVNTLGDHMRRVNDIRRNVHRAVPVGDPWRRSIVRHLEEWRDSVEIGTEATIAQLADFRSDEYGPDLVASGALVARLMPMGKPGNVIPGIEFIEGSEPLRYRRIPAETGEVPF